MGEYPSNPVRAPLRLESINGLRGAAILSVIYFHVICGMWPAPVVPVWLSPLVTNGWTGVNLFFILSGLVLFLPYAAGERRMISPADRAAFYQHRFLRLMPLFYVAVVSEWLLAVWQGHGNVGELAWVASLGFTVNAQEFAPPFNPALWSIGVEIAFSALFPSLIAAAQRFGLARVLAGALVMSLAFRVFGILRFPALQGATFNSDMLLCRIDEFVIGMMLARLYVSGRLPWRPALCLVAGALLVAIAWIGFDQVLRGGLPPIARAALNDVLDAGLFLVVRAALAAETRFAAALCWRPLQVLGMMCYSVYIWHEPLLELMMPGRAALPAPAFALSLLLFAAALLAVAALSYRVIEFGRVADWRRLFLLGRSQPAPV
ncbi:MAG: acyltransferase [Stellaceae bacterium]